MVGLSRIAVFRAGVAEAAVEGPEGGVRGRVAAAGQKAGGALNGTAPAASFFISPAGGGLRSGSYVSSCCQQGLRYLDKSQNKTKSQHKYSVS